MLAVESIDHLLQNNLLKDPPFPKMNLVSCRNLLIYLKPILQKKVFTVLHYALQEKGILILGKSETIGSSTELFSSVTPRNCTISNASFTNTPAGV